MRQQQLEQAIRDAIRELAKVPPLPFNPNVPEALKILRRAERGART